MSNKIIVRKYLRRESCNNITHCVKICDAGHKSISVKSFSVSNSKSLAMLQKTLPSDIRLMEVVLRVRRVLYRANRYVYEYSLY